MVVATKRSVSKGKKKPLVTLDKGEKITEYADFGTFEVIITDRHAIFKNRTGFEIKTSPYTVGLDGKAQTLSLYAWLKNLVKTKKAVEGHENEPVEGTDITMGDLLNTDKIITEANLTKPIVIFTDVDEAAKAAKEHIQWLQSQSEKLQKTIENGIVEDEDMNQRILAEDKADMEITETLKELI